MIAQPAQSGPYRVNDVMTRAAVAVGRKALFKDLVERNVYCQ
ncbi:hypothetical protein ACF08B_22140 [Streptomyces sp. NPDC015139]